MRRTGASTRNLPSHADLLVDGRDRAKAAFGEQVDVLDMEVLVRLARSLDCSIAHVPDPWTGRDLFFLDDAGTRYRFRAAHDGSARRTASV